jgi:hypothetical protein
VPYLLLGVVGPGVRWLESNQDCGSGSPERAMVVTRYQYPAHDERATKLAPGQGVEFWARPSSESPRFDMVPHSARLGASPNHSRKARPS